MRALIYLSYAMRMITLSEITLQLHLQFCCFLQATIDPVLHSSADRHIYPVANEQDLVEGEDGQICVKRIWKILLLIFYRCSAMGSACFRILWLMKSKILDSMIVPLFSYHQKKHIYTPH